MLITIAIILHVLGIFSSIHAVMTTRTSQGAIAWAISLITFPYVAVPAYWVLGRNKFQGYTSSRQSNKRKVQEKLKDVYTGLEPYHVKESELSQGEKAGERLVDIPYLNGNDIELLIDGERTFNSIIEGMDKAKEYILFQFFIVKDDQIGRRVKDHLIAKAKEGVKVYFIYDEVGSKKLPDAYKDDLRAVGVEVNDFHTQKGFGNRFQLNFRNHRKVVVVDGKSAWIGGHNVGDEYLGRDPKFGHWRDTHIRIEGPAAIAVQISFLEDWYWATGNHISHLRWEPVASKTQDKKILIIPSSPADKLETAALMYLEAINSAKKRIWIASPYFIPDDAIVAALQLAGLRGVDVRILIPDMADHLAVYLAAFTYVEEASLTGVKFFRYTDGFLHQKVMLIDDTHATVGTANFDNRSFRLNFEIIGLIADAEFNTEIEQMLLNDFTHAREMTKDEVDNKSFIFKLGARIARLTAPIQ